MVSRLDGKLFFTAPVGSSGECKNFLLVVGVASNG
jgi:hypothetical protein